MQKIYPTILLGIKNSMLKFISMLILNESGGVLHFKTLKCWTETQYVLNLFLTSKIPTLELSHLHPILIPKQPINKANHPLTNPYPNHSPLPPFHISGTQLYHTTPPTKSTHHFTFHYPHNLTFITPKFNIQTKLNPPQSSLTLLTTPPSIKNSLNFHLISPNL